MPSDYAPRSRSRSSSPNISERVVPSALAYSTCPGAFLVRCITGSKTIVRAVQLWAMVVLLNHPKRIFTYTCLPQHGGCGSAVQVEIFQGVYNRPFTCPICGKTITMNVELPLPGATLLPRQTVHAFGDESSYGDVIAYGIVAVHAHNRHTAERLLAGLKRRYGVDPEEEFHFAELYHQDTRKKTGWKHLPIYRIFDFAEVLVSGLLGVPVVFTVGAAHQSEQPVEFSEAGHFPAFKMGTKELTALQCGGALLPLSQVFDQSQIKFWTDPDRTPISFGYGKVQAHRMHYLNNSDANQRIVAEPPDEQGTPLLQMADLFAFTATHALTEKRYRFKNRFERLYRMCSPAHSFMGYHDEDETKFKPLPSRLEVRHNQIMSGGESP